MESLLMEAEGMVITFGPKGVSCSVANVIVWCLSISDALANSKEQGSDNDDVASPGTIVIFPDCGWLACSKASILPPLIFFRKKNVTKKSG